jgi:hypothetical protein
MTTNGTSAQVTGRSWVTPGEKGMKSFGYVLNIACDHPTGLFVSGLLTEFCDTATSGEKLILQRALQFEIVKEI